MIKITNLSKFYHNNQILKNINLQIGKGEIHGLIGTSGAGKSTLLRTINGLEPFQSGEVIVDGKAIHQLSAEELRFHRKEMGMIFQNFALISRKTVLENVILPMECWKYDKSEAMKKALELLDLVGIGGKKNERPETLSGGQKQRVAIARALSLNPKILLCDEPTSALDPKTAKSVLKLLDQINHEFKITILFVAHEMSAIKSLCSRMSIISDGTISCTDDVIDVFMNEPDSLLEIINQEKISTNEDRVIKLMIEDIREHHHFLADLQQNNIMYSFISASSDVFCGQAVSFIYLGSTRQDINIIAQKAGLIKMKYRIIQVEKKRC